MAVELDRVIPIALVSFSDSAHEFIRESEREGSTNYVNSDEVIACEFTVRGINML